MMVVKNVLNRIHVQRLLLAAALFGLSLSCYARGLPNLAAVSAGKSTVIKVASDGTPLATKAPSALTPGGGWTNAGNYGVAAGAGGAAKVGAEATVNVAGNAVPISAIGAVAKESIIGGVVGAATGGIPGAVLGVATPLAIAYINSSFAGSRINPDTGVVEARDETRCYISPCHYYIFMEKQYFTLEDACLGYAAWQNSMNNGRATIAHAGDPKLNTCYVKQTMPDGSISLDGNYGVGVVTGGGRDPDSPTWYPITPQALKDALYKKDPDPRIVPELEKAGVDAKALPVTDISVAGPAAIAGPSTTTINNIDNSVTTSQTTNNYTYNGDTVTSGGQTTKTETTKPDGTKTSSTTTTVSPGDAEPAKPEEPKVQCDKYPNSLGCAELDTPDAEIPKDTKTVNFTAEDPFGSGRCPADVMASFRAIGAQSVKIVDWSTFCDMALPLRGLVMALASIMAFFIIMPGGVRE